MNEETVKFTTLYWHTVISHHNAIAPSPFMADFEQLPGIRAAGDSEGSNLLSASRC